MKSFQGGLSLEMASSKKETYEKILYIAPFGNFSSTMCVC